MSSKTKPDGGPAFPVPLELNANDMVIQDMSPGMTLRDWFAGMALQGMLSSGGHGNVTVGGKSLPYDAAAFLFADAMIKLRNK